MTRAKARALRGAYSQLHQFRDRAAGCVASVYTALAGLFKRRRDRRVVHADAIRIGNQASSAVFLTLLVLCLGGCVGLPPRGEARPSHAISDGQTTSLGKLSSQSAPEANQSLSGFHLLPDGGSALDARIALIRHAERSLDVQYYLLRGDEVGLLLLRELRNASVRGVRVRLLVDDLYTAGEDELFATFASFPNIEVRLFNPLPSRAATLGTRLALSLWQLARINHRMHNKLMVADNSFAISGGRNIGNEYFMRDATANFLDIDVMSSGPIVREMSEVFDRFWNSDQVWPIATVAPLTRSPLEAQGRFDALARAALPNVQLSPRDIFGSAPISLQLATGQLDRHWALARVYADPPEKLLIAHDEAARRGVMAGALAAISGSRRQAKVVSPYFLPGPDGMATLKKLVATGGKVVVITNSLGSTDEPLAYAGYERYRFDMLKAGMTLYEVAPEGIARTRRFGDFGKSQTRLHAKVALIDESQLFIGSMNLDHRSAAINTEVALMIDSPPMAGELNRLLTAEHVELGYRLRLSEDGRSIEWLSHDEAGEHLVHKDVPGSHLWLRFKNWLLINLLGEELL